MINFLFTRFEYSGVDSVKYAIENVDLVRHFDDRIEYHFDCSDHTKMADIVPCEEIEFNVFIDFNLAGEEGSQC